MLLSGFGACCAMESSRNHFACMHVLVDAIIRVTDTTPSEGKPGPGQCWGEGRLQFGQFNRAIVLHCACARKECFNVGDFTKCIPVVMYTVAKQAVLMNLITKGHRVPSSCQVLGIHNVPV